MFKLKTTLADTLFSKLVKAKGGYQCVRCGKKHEENSMNSGNSHYWGRANKSTRFDFENCDILCNIPCHSGKDSRNIRGFGWEYQKQIKGYNGVKENGAYTEFKINQLGQARFDALMIRAHTPAKIDEKLLRQGLKLEWRKMEIERKAKIFGSR